VGGERDSSARVSSDCFGALFSQSNAIGERVLVHILGKKAGLCFRTLNVGLLVATFCFCGRLSKMEAVDGALRLREKPEWVTIHPSLNKGKLV